MQHCHSTACSTAYCEDAAPETRNTPIPAWRLSLGALVDAVNRLHHYRNLRARMFAQGMHRFDCEDRE